MTVSSVLYMVYSIRLLLYPEIPNYHMYVALAIAAFTFTELVLNIRGIVVERKNRMPLVHAIKMLNLASSLICLVLTQTAILSFASSQTSEHSMVNGRFGILVGAVASVLGIFMAQRAMKVEKKINNENTDTEME